MATCLSCLGPGAEEAAPYHRSCLRALFGMEHVPRIEVHPDRLHEVALQMIGRQSLSGVARKLSLGLDRERLTLRVQVAGAAYILKPGADLYPALPQTELLSMRLAERAGLAVPPCGLFPLQDGSLAYLVRRFDRREDGSKRRQEDFCQLAGLPPKEKYAGSYERCARLLLRFASAPLVEVQRLFHRVVVAWWMGDGDLHLKNLSLLQGDDGRHRLSPVYDAVATGLYLPDDGLALTVQGKRRQLGRPDWLRFAGAISLPERAAARVLGRVAGTLAPALDLLSASPLPDALKGRLRAHLEAATRALQET